MSEEKMIREIANDDITPKKYNKVRKLDLHETDYEDDGLDYDTDSMVLNEF